MIEFRTKLGKEEIVALNTFHTFTKRRSLVLGLSLLFFALFGYSYVLTRDFFNLVLAIVFGLGFPGLTYLLLVLGVNRNVKTTKLVSDETLIEFRFDEDGIEVKVDKPDFHSLATMKWSQLYEAYAHKDHYFAYIGNKQSYVLPKACLTSGTAEEFEDLLARKMGRKFRKR